MSKGEKAYFSNKLIDSITRSVIISYFLGFLTAIIVFGLFLFLIIWMRKKSAAMPVRGSGMRLLVPIPLLFVVFSIILFSYSRQSGDMVIPSVLEISIAVLLGVVLGLIIASQIRYEVKNGEIYPARNKAIFYVIIGILVLRLAMFKYFQDITQDELMLLAYTLAFTYLSFWSAGSFVKYRKLNKQLEKDDQK